MNPESESVMEANAIRTHGNRIRKIYQFGAVLIAVAMISSALTLTVYGDPPDSAPNTVIDWEGLDAYKINGIRYANPDDVDSIQDAIDDSNLDGKGGLIIVPKGDYTSTTYITIYNHIALIGVGMGTHITFTTDTSMGLFVNNYDGNVLIKDMWLTGPGRSSETAQHGIAGTGNYDVTVQNVRLNAFSEDTIIFNSGSRITISNCILDNNKEGIELKGAYDCQIAHNVINDTLEEAFELVSNTPAVVRTYNISIHGNIIKTAARGVWILGNCSNILVDSNMFTGLTHAGVMTDFAGAGSYGTDIHIRGNLFQSKYGVWLNTAGWQNVFVEGNTFTHTLNWVLNVNAYGRNITFQNNFINDVYGTDADAIRISGGPYNVSLRGNTISDVTRYAMNTGGVNLIIEGNTITDCGDTGIILSVANSTVVGNMIIGEGSTSTAGVYINGVKNCTIMSNRISGYDYGVYGGGGCDYEYVIGNNFKGCDTAHSIVGSNNVIVNNTGV